MLGCELRFSPALAASSEGIEPRLAAPNVEPDCGGHNEKAEDYGGDYECFAVVFDEGNH